MSLCNSNNLREKGDGYLCKRKKCQQGEKGTLGQGGTGREKYLSLSTEHSDSGKWGM